MNSVVSSFLSKRLIDRGGGHRHHVLRAFQEKLDLAQGDPETQTRHQNALLASLLRHAQATVPRVRSLLGAASVIDENNARAALAALPVVGRGEIQADPGYFTSESASPLFDDATGGSSGTPMRFKVDRQTQVARESSLYWADQLAGWSYGERIAMLWGSDKDLKSAAQQARSRLRWWIDNRRWYNAFEMGPDRMAAFDLDMERFRPDIIVAYAGSLEVFAHYLEDSGRKPAYPRRGLVCSAEVLTPAARETITRVFRKPVFDRYGNREFGAIAVECPGHDGLHLNGADMIVEVDGSGADQAGGCIVVTYLRNRGMPFLRYNTGDLGSPASGGRCTCGCTWPRLNPVSGRMSDTIRTRHGRLIHGEYFTHLLYGAPRVREFQFVQVSLDHYRLLLVATGREESAWEERIRESIHDEVGRESRVDIDYVDRIPLLASGKRKFTLSLITNPGATASQRHGVGIYSSAPGKEEAE